jgi:hypothetical protein
MASFTIHFVACKNEIRTSELYQTCNDNGIGLKTIFGTSSRKKFSRLRRRVRNKPNVKNSEIIKGETIDHSAN